MNNKRHFLNLFLFALVIRLFYKLFLVRHDMLSLPLLDAENYVNWASSILHGGTVGKGIFFAEPLYAYVLALFTYLFKDGTFVMLFLQTLLGALLPIVVFLLAKRVFNKPVAVISALLTATYGPFIFYENFILKTSIETFSITLFILCCTYVLGTKKKLLYAALGFMLGVMIILKGNFLIVIPLIVGIILIFTHGTLKTKSILAAIFTASCFLAISPVTIRNYLVGHDFVLTNYSVGMFVYQGNWWDADGSLLQPPFSRPVPKYEEGDFYKMAESYAGKKLKPSETSNFWVTKAFEEIKDDPERWLGLLKTKALLVINRVELGDNYDYALYQKFIPILYVLPNFWMTSTFGLTGILLLLFSPDLRMLLQKKSQNHSVHRAFSTLQSAEFRNYALVVGLVLFYIAFMLSGSLSSRYRQPIIPFLLMLASTTLWYLWKKITSADWNRCITSGVVCVFFIYLTSVNLPNFAHINDANFYNLVSSYHLDRNQDMEAYKIAQEGLEIDENFPWLYSQLFTIYMRSGQVVLAKEALDRQIILRPDDPGGYNRLKLFYDLKDKPAPFIQRRLKLEEEKNDFPRDPYIYESMRAMQKKDTVKARKLLQESLKKRNRPMNTLIMLATLEKEAGNMDKAAIYLDEAIRRDKFYLAAHYNRANIHLQKKEYAEAAKLLRHIVDLVPDYGEAWYYLGASLINDKQLDAALPVVKGYIEKYEDHPVKKEKAAYFKSLLEAKPTEESENVDEAVSTDDNVQKSE